MKNALQIKLKLYESCLQYVEDSLKTVHQIMESNKQALGLETKSSAGDKHETSRAMLQLEMEKASQQLGSINQMKAAIQKVNIESNQQLIALGSLVITDKLNYFLAISAGRITIDTADYYAISVNTPIGQQLLGKKQGDVIAFNSAEIKMIY